MSNLDEMPRQPQIARVGMIVSRYIKFDWLENAVETFVVFDGQNWVPIHTEEEIRNSFLFYPPMHMEKIQAMFSQEA